MNFIFFGERVVGSGPMCTNVSYFDHVYGQLTASGLLFGGIGERLRILSTGNRWAD